LKNKGNKQQFENYINTKNIAAFVQECSAP